MDKLPKCGANYVPLTPLTFLERAAAVYSDRTSVVYEQTRFTWKQTFDRCRRLAASLRSINISKNDVVSILAPNIPAMYEVHFAVPMSGAVLNTINTRLDARNVATILLHSEAKLFFVDRQYSALARDALEQVAASGSPSPLVVMINDEYAPPGVPLGELEYEDLVAAGDGDFTTPEVEDEWDPIALNYTSGTTSAPKGVVYSHRGAYLSTVSLLLQWGVGTEPVYLWVLPMFHCNGWTFTWGVAARGGTNVCIRNAAAAEIFRAISENRVTHMCCAPIVFNILLEGREDRRRQLVNPVHVLTGGAPPPAALLERVEESGFRVTHAYGLTEATGPALVCEWRTEWDQLSTEEKSRIKARQGVSVLSLADADVKDAESMQSVPRDGRSVGEIVLRGSSIMKGYFKNDAETAAAFRDGWFFTGDVGVVHPDGYLEIKDRSKDVIISGGENISSVEVEAVIYRHPAVLEAAVVAMPHPRWGETPCAFVALKKDFEEVTEADVIAHCRRNLPGYMVPKKAVVGAAELPKTSTGKIKKFELRETARGLEVDWDRAEKAQRSTKAQVRGPGNRKGQPNEAQHEQVLARSRL